MCRLNSNAVQPKRTYSEGPLPSPVPGLPLFAASACSTDSGWTALFENLMGADTNKCDSALLSGDPGHADLAAYEQACVAVHKTEDYCRFDNVVSLGTLFAGIGIIPPAGGQQFSSRDDMLNWARSQFGNAKYPQKFAQAYKPRPGQTLEAYAVEYDGNWYAVRVEPSTKAGNEGGTKLYAEIYDGNGNLLADPKYLFDPNGAQLEEPKMTRPQFEPEPGFQAPPVIEP